MKSERIEQCERMIAEIAAAKALSTGPTVFGLITATLEVLLRRVLIRMPTASVVISVRLVDRGWLIDVRRRADSGLIVEIRVPWVDEKVVDGRQVELPLVKK
jgi:hypothetical protein